jgi:hypothetical protein
LIANFKGVEAPLFGTQTIVLGDYPFTTGIIRDAYGIGMKLFCNVDDRNKRMFNMIEESFCQVLTTTVTQDCCGFAND